MCSLHECPSKCRAKIISVQGGRSLQRRCCDMGLIPGSEITVQMNYGGRMHINCRGASYAVGGGMAEKIMVSRE
jgi:Fe2+ transport system protein FeoA